MLNTFSLWLSADTSEACFGAFEEWFVRLNPDITFDEAVITGPTIRKIT
jgi:hypothetical protein